MVNEEASILRSTLVRLLRDSPSPHSGEELGVRLGISRVAVHKHIKRLKEHGYQVESGPSGYRLNRLDTPSLSTWDFEPDENIRVSEIIDSTMNEAHRLARRHPDEDFTVAAISQTSGRGRGNRHWESPEGGLWVTRWIHPGGSSLRIQLYVMAAAYVLAELLRNRWNLDAMVKWPNDVLVNNRKIAGMLGEAEVAGDRIKSLALGLGMNVNNQSAPGRISLKDLLGHPVDRKPLLRNWISNLDEFLVSSAFPGDGEPLWFTSVMSDIGASVGMETTHGPIVGIIAGVDEFGRIRLETKNGPGRLIEAGDMIKQTRSSYAG
ncbi:MAG: biotin--[acetyl-CoA-carboxylase] ligase [Spirochaetaceae bacterium]|nr:biotin--[acetyl-CoA-carboxylase] ligase [Spirochaetaceae bacterium]